MRRIAFFVEGYSEMLFVERLVTEVAGAHNILVEQIQIRGGSTVPRSIAVVKAARPIGAEQFYVLIVDCGGDHQVKTRIMEEHELLTRKGYERIIGLRDVRPTFTRADIPRLERGLRLYIKTSLAPVDFILSTMELEAWFLAEFNHYGRIDPAITPDAVFAATGYHPETDDPSVRNNPTADLVLSYSLANKIYEKATVKNTIDALDFGYVYLTLKDRIAPLKLLSDQVDDFLTAPAR